MAKTIRGLTKVEAQQMALGLIVRRVVRDVTVARVAGLTGEYELLVDTFTGEET